MRNISIPNGFEIRKANHSDVESLMNLFMETASWLKSIGQTQWGHFLDGDGRDDVLESIENKTAYVFLNHAQQLLGTVTVQLDPDPWDNHIWGNRDHHDSIFIHRLAISRKESGKRLGSVILNWIADELDFPETKKYLRLDCVGNNFRLNEYYKQNGFLFMGSTDGHNKYQRELAR